MALDVVGQFADNLVLWDRADRGSFARIDCSTVQGKLEQWPTFRIGFHRRLLVHLGNFHPITQLKEEVSLHDRVALPNSA